MNIGAYLCGIDNTILLDEHMIPDMQREKRHSADGDEKMEVGKEKWGQLVDWVKKGLLGNMQYLFK